MDAVLSRALEFAKFELIFGRAELISELPARLAAVTDADVQAAAAALRPERRAVVELIAGGAR
jgi:predicted Zn-dependent peptidase